MLSTMLLYVDIFLGAGVERNSYYLLLHTLIFDAHLLHENMLLGKYSFNSVLLP
jgi:hypothetical protein